MCMCGMEVMVSLVVPSFVIVSANGLFPWIHVSISDYEFVSKLGYVMDYEVCQGGCLCGRHWFFFFWGGGREFASKMF